MLDNEIGQDEDRDGTVKPYSIEENWGLPEGSNRWNYNGTEYYKRAIMLGSNGYVVEYYNTDNSNE